MNRLNKTESAVFLYCWFSLFLKDPFLQIIDNISESSQMKYKGLLAENM